MRETGGCRLGDEPTLAADDTSARWFPETSLDKDVRPLRPVHVRSPRDIRVGLGHRYRRSVAAAAESGEDVGVRA